MKRQDLAMFFFMIDEAELCIDKDVMNEMMQFT